HGALRSAADAAGAAILPGSVRWMPPPRSRGARSLARESSPIPVPVRSTDRAFRGRRTSMNRTCSARAPRSSRLARVIGLVLVFALAKVGLGQPLHGTIDTTLYRFDPGAPGATLVGTMALKLQHVSLRLARQPNGGLIGIATTFFFPTTSVYTVDP